MNSTLLMCGKNMQKLILIFVKGIINIDDLSAGITEDNVAAFK